MLEIKNIHKTFNKGTINEKAALRGINWTLHDGDFVTIIGGNGAGKSTLLNMLSGVYYGDEGQILIDGEDITNLPEHKRAKYFGRVFQDPMTGTAAKVLEISEKIISENHLTAMMVTHNMKDAITYGNRLIMMHEGQIIYDVSGEEKKNLKVADLLEKFEEVSGGEFANDRMMLS